MKKQQEVLKEGGYINDRGWISRWITNNLWIENRMVGERKRS